jgi:hypothetical protein
MTHEEIQSLLGAYAVDAVDADEAAEVDAHLVDCPRCRAEVAELREVAAMLTYSGGADAPEGVWESIAGSLTGTPPPLRLEVQRERRNRWRVPRNVAIGVAAASVGVLGIGVIRLRGEVDDLRNSQHTDQAAVALAAERAIGSPDARLARLTGSSGDGAVAVLQPNGQGYFIGTSLPEVGPNIYQLWGMTSSGTITSLGTVPGPGVYGFSADPSIETVMVTVEDEPVPQPTSDPVMRGDLA